jgi:hypothetical protein
MIEDAGLGGIAALLEASDAMLPSLCTLALAAPLQLATKKTASGTIT